MGHAIQQNWLRKCSECNTISRRRDKDYVYSTKHRSCNWSKHNSRPRFSKVRTVRRLTLSACTSEIKNGTEIERFGNTNTTCSLPYGHSKSRRRLRKPGHQVLVSIYVINTGRCWPELGLTAPSCRVCSQLPAIGFVPTIRQHLISWMRRI